MLRYFQLLSFVFFRLILRILRRKSDSIFNVLLFQNNSGIGDQFIALDAIYNVYELVKIKPNGCLYIACSPSKEKIFRILGFNKRVKYIDLSKKGEENTAEYFIRMSRGLSNCSWEYILFLEYINLFWRVMIFTLIHREAIFPVMREARGFKSRVLQILNLIGRDKCIEYDMLGVEKRIHHAVIAHEILKCFIRSLGIDSWNYKRYEVPRLCDVELKEEYCVLAMGCNLQNPHQYRGWSLDRYVSVCKWILDNTDLKIYLTGTNEEQYLNQQICKIVGNSSRVYDYSGELSFEEWVEMLRSAKFVLGNDSGTIHVAVKVGTVSYVVAGYWNYGEYLPYPAEGLVRDVRCGELSCKLCDSREEEHTWIECEKCVTETGMYKCIDNVSVEMVINEIKGDFGKIL